MTDLARAHDASATNGRQAADADASWPGDAVLIAAISRGDRDALAKVYRRHGAHVHRRAAELSGQDRADDVTQEVFLRLWKRPESYDPARGSLRTFLLMQAHGRAVDLLRSDGARRSRESADWVRRGGAGVEVEVEALARLIGDTVAQLLLTLPADERNPIALAYFGGYSYREVALLLDRPEGTIKSRIRSGLARLRAGLGSG